MPLLLLVLTLVLMLVPGRPLAALPEDEARIQNREGVLRARRGDWDRAIAAFTRAHRADPFDETARANLASAHNNLGVMNCRNRRFPEGIAHFEAARALKR